MDKKTALSVLRIVLVTVWRLALAVAVLAGLVCAGLYLTLQTILCGPSEAARDQLTLTLLESDVTRDIPGHFLDQATIDAIRTVPDTLPATVSDPSRITMDPAPVDQPETVIDGGHYCATVTLMTDASSYVFSFTEGTNFAGFNTDGVLTVASDAPSAQALGIQGRCDHILIMDGQANEALFAAASGYAPRTAVGQRADGTVILISTDGWTKEHPGATYQDLINLMTHYGAVNACLISSGSEG